MPLDGTVLGRCASEQMEALENDFGQDEGVTIGTVVTIVELRKTEDDGQRVSAKIRLRTNVADLYHVIGVIDQAKHDLLTI